MASITIFFDTDELPTGSDGYRVISADPPTVTLLVKNDEACYFRHHQTDKPELVTGVSTNLKANKAIEVVLTPFDTTHPAVTPKRYEVVSNPPPHEDFLNWRQNGNDHAANVRTPSVVNKTTLYTLEKNAPPFLTIKVKRQ